MRTIMSFTLNLILLPITLIIVGCTPQACRLPAYPVSISNNAVTSVIHDDGTWSIYSFMGITHPKAVQTITPACYRLDQGQDHWVQLADAPLTNSKPRIGASALTIADQVYLVGGYAVMEDATEVTEPRLFHYDLDLDNFMQVSTVPTEVDDTLACAWRDRYIVLVSGWHGPTNDNTPAIQIYDTMTNSWTQATPLPAPHSGLFGQSGSITGDTLIIEGGVKNDLGFVISNDIWIGTLNPQTPASITWRTLPEHPGQATYRAASNAGASHSGPAYIVGGTHRPYNISGIGYDKSPATPLRQLLIFQPDSLAIKQTSPPACWVPTMDHRGLISIGHGRWVIVGGMTSPGIATNLVQMLNLPELK